MAFRRLTSNILNGAIATTGVYIQEAAPSSELKTLRTLLSAHGCPFELTRLGDENDGGYLIPECIDQIDCVISAGIGSNLSFELEIGKGKMPVFMADGSITKPSDLPAHFHFLCQNVAAIDADGEGLLLPTISVNHWLTDIEQKIAFRSALMKLDVEGTELEILLSLPEMFLDRIGVLVVEFHDLQSAANPAFCALLQAALRKLNRSHKVCHLHPNNYGGWCNLRGEYWPRTLEVTFMSRKLEDLAIASGCSLQPPILPHPLDCRNQSEGRDMALNMKDWAAA